MNILRILASGKNGFREEFASVLLGYLLDPNGDHGCGAVFLQLFAEAAGAGAGLSWPKQWADGIQQRLRGRVLPGANGAIEPASISIGFEEPCFGRDNRLGFIDVVVSDRQKHFLLVENKIRATSKLEGQLQDEYEGFRKKLRGEEVAGAHVLIVYLVPARWVEAKDSWVENTDFADELNFSRQPDDGAALLTWQDIPGSKYPSIVALLRKLLERDERGDISPLSHETRHFLRSLIHFALEEFEGIASTDTAQGTAIDKDRTKVSTILTLAAEPGEEVYVGIQAGMSGLIQRAWKNPGFLNQELNVARSAAANWQYLKLEEFQHLARWAMDPDQEPLSGVVWKGKPLTVDTLYFVAKAVGEGIAIGVRGGLEALKTMAPDEVRKRLWEIAGKRRNSQWFTGTEFCKVLEERGLAPKHPKPSWDPT